MKLNKEPDSTAAGRDDEEILSLLERNVEAMSALDTASEDTRPSSHRVIDSIGRSLETPAFFVTIALGVGTWVGVNMVGARFGIAAFDPPPFSRLQGIISLASLITTVAVLVKQSGIARRDRHRDRVELQLAILTEQKVAKVIALLEELRRDSPTVDDRRDPEAEVFGKTVHPQKVFDTIKQNLGGEN